MKKAIYVILVLLTVFLFAAKCEDGGSSPSTDDPKSICGYLFDNCDNEFYSGDMGDCLADLNGMEECRFECVIDTKVCDIMHDCLYYGFSDANLSNYCTLDGQSKNHDKDDGNTGDTFEDCAEEKCATENDACKANSDCVAIFDVCYPSCDDGDMDCLAICALDYLGGVEEHDALYGCLVKNCSD